MSRLPIVLSVLAIVFFLGCEDFPTETEAETALFKKGGKPGGGGGGGGGPADPVIAFRSNRALRVMNADGSNSTVVVTDIGSGWAWSPLGDGSATAPYQIVFERGGGSLATVDITTPAEGGIVATAPSTIGATGDFVGTYNPAWSPDGSRIAFHANLGEICANGEGQGETDLWTMSVVSTPDGVEGSDLKRHTYNCDNYVFARYPSWSPDGNAIAFLEDGGGTTAIKILHLDGSPIETVFDAGNLPDVSSVRHRPDWGRVDTEPKLVVNAIRMKAGRKHPELVWAVYTLPLQKDDGHYSKAGLPVWEIDGRRPSWSPDDKYFVMDGVTVYEVETGQTTRLARGEMADWRRPDPSTP